MTCMERVWGGEGVGQGRKALRLGRSGGDAEWERGKGKKRAKARVELGSEGLQRTRNPSLEDGSE